MKIKDYKFDKSWTLFLDRDGVINTRIIDNYVIKWEQFEFLPGVLDALKTLSGIFGKIFIVSNQQGIGKGLMTEDDLKIIHDNMIKVINENGGRIDKVYHCPFKAEDNSALRKPEVGMALKAKKEFSEINFKRSVMVGDSSTDLEFGQRLNMLKVFLSSDILEIRQLYKLIDYAYVDLYGFSEDIS